MLDVIVIVVAVSIFSVGFAIRRRQQADRRAAARTVDLVIDGDGVRRTLGDGRSEQASWARLVSAEVVCTPVTTADGARAFVLLAEGTEAGCLVPLGVGHDDALLVQLARLVGFRTQDFVAATEHRPPRRTTVWTRPEVRPE